jgi:hypothetical protein
MSELTQCNWHSLQYIKRQYGDDNVKLLPARGSELGGLDVYVRKNKDAPWSEKPVAWFMQLTAHCVC